MPNIYDLHDKAFAGISAYVITKDGTRFATIAFKSPRDGAGRLWAYVHRIGIPMERGYASGGGYDRHSAACASAARRMLKGDNADHDAFRAALLADDGTYWYDALRKAGFEVWQAV